MGLGKDGELLAEARNGCLADLYKRYLLKGFHGRCNGSRARKNPSPIPGSTIVLGDEDSVVVVHQAENGRGPLRVVTYRRGSTDLGEEVERRLRESGLLS